MEFDFTTSTLAKLSKPLQKAKYNQLAAQAEKSGFSSLAKQWRALAEETEKTSAPAVRALSVPRWAIGKRDKTSSDAGRPAFGKRPSAPAASATAAPHDDNRA